MLHVLIDLLIVSKKIFYHSLVGFSFLINKKHLGEREGGGGYYKIQLKFKSMNSVGIGFKCF